MGGWGRVGKGALHFLAAGESLVVVMVGVGRRPLLLLLLLLGVGGQGAWWGSLVGGNGFMQGLVP